MKKYWMMLVTLTMAVCAVSVAQAGEVTITGDAVRGKLVGSLVDAYFPGSEVIVTDSSSLGEYVMVVGPAGGEKIHFSPPLVAKLQALNANAKAGAGLMDICPTQARQLQAAVGKSSLLGEDKSSGKGGFKSTGKPAAPALTVKETKSACDLGGGCYGKVLTGDYQTLEDYQGVRLVSNTNNPKYPANSITFKLEYQEEGLTGWKYKTGWGPTIVLRNVTMENPLDLLEVNGHRMMAYLASITTLKGQAPGKRGDSCWEVVILRDGTIYKDESPSQARFSNGNG